MEFYLQIDHPVFGKITSEIYTGTNEDYIKIRSELTNNISSNLDFYTESDGYVIIPSDVIKSSLVYLKRVEDDDKKKKK